MGYEQVSGSLNITFPALWAGWFPGKSYNDIPGSIADPSQPIGSPDCDNSIWYDGALRKMPGYTVVTSSALNGNPTSLYYSPTLDEFVGTAGTKLYKGMNNAAPTDITRPGARRWNTLIQSETQ